MDLSTVAGCHVHGIVSTIFPQNFAVLFVTLSSFVLTSHVHYLHHVCSQTGCLGSSSLPELTLHILIFHSTAMAVMFQSFLQNFSGRYSICFSHCRIFYFVAVVYIYLGTITEFQKWVAPCDDSSTVIYCPSPTSQRAFFRSFHLSYICNCDIFFILCRVLIQRWLCQHLHIQKIFKNRQAAMLLQVK